MKPKKSPNTNGNQSLVPRSIVESIPTNQQSPITMSGVLPTAWLERSTSQPTNYHVTLRVRLDRRVYHGEGQNREVLPTTWLERSTNQPDFSLGDGVGVTGAPSLWVSARVATSLQTFFSSTGVCGLLLTA